MEWAIWDKGRRFVQSDGSPLELNFCCKYKTTTVVAPAPVEVEIDTVDQTTPGTVVNTTPGTVVKTTPVLGSTLGIEERNESSTTNDVVSILEALGEESYVADEQAALQLLHTCRSVCHDASANEIVSMIREKGAVMQSRRDVRNPIGFLLTSVASVFDGDGIKSYRRRQAAAAALAEQRNQEEKRNREEMHGWLLSERDRLTLLVQNPDESPKRQDAARQRLSEVQSALKSYAEEGT
jgi:hypothetical protein